MKPFLFEASTLVRTSPLALYAFHENPENIEHVAPRSMIVKRIACAPRARVGETFRIEASQFGVPIRWLGKWEIADKPRLLVDTACESPFAIWRHSHLFEEHPHGARLTDHVEYLLKGGMAGKLLSKFVMPMVFATIFHSRHERTRRYFENQ